MTNDNDIIWCPVCARQIPKEEYEQDKQNLINTPDNACKDCRAKK